MNRFLGFLLLFSILSCAGSSPQTQSPNSRLPADCWLLQPVAYRLRQSAKLEYRDKQEMLEGFMELDLKQRRAHLVIFNALGLTLLNLEVERHGYELVEATINPKDQSPANRRKQQFANAVATAVQNIFFSLKNCRESFNDRNPQPVTEFSGKPPRLTKICDNRQKPRWVVTFHDYDQELVGQAEISRLPNRIILQNRKPDYRLTLWLHKAEVL
ncbi:MAG: DUF3261 domain-containing protein [Pseudomonadota bacterium]|nr:DUF3261 domain-containing protein [Pseudomonadota bacterium]